MGAFGTIFQFEAYAATLLERFEPFHLNGRKMGKYIGSFFIRFDKTKSFGIAEPFNRTCSHGGHCSIFEKELMKIEYLQSNRNTMYIAKQDLILVFLADLMRVI